MRNFIRYSFLLVFVILIGCKGDDSSIVANSSLKGKMVGYVYGNDTTSRYGFIDSLPNLGIQISIDGTSFNTLSGKDGRWELDSVPAGTYNISFTKPGFAMEKTIAYRFIGNGTDYLGITTIDQIAHRNVTFTFQPFKDSSSGSIALFTCRISADDSLYPNIVGAVLILFGKSDILSPLDPNSYLASSDNINLSGNSPSPNGYNIEVYRNALLSAGFHSGDNIFCQAFVSDLSGNNTINGHQYFFEPSYFDINSGKQVYTGFGNNHSDVKSFLLP